MQVQPECRPAFAERFFTCWLGNLRLDYQVHRRLLPIGDLVLGQGLVILKEAPLVYNSELPNQRHIHP